MRRHRISNRFLNPMPRGNFSKKYWHRKWKASYDTMPFLKIRNFAGIVNVL